MIGTLLLPGHVLIIPQYILFRSLGWVGADWPYLPLSTSESAVGPMFAMSLLSLIPVFLFFVAFQRMATCGPPCRRRSAASAPAGPPRNGWWCAAPAASPRTPG